MRINEEIFFKDNNNSFFTFYKLNENLKIGYLAFI